MITHDNTVPREGICPGHTGPTSGGETPDSNFMQSITTANCPVTRTLAVDARDNRTYWIQKMPDGKCWMLTNLAYAGGGDNTYGDAKSLNLIANGVLTLGSNATPRYSIPSNANPTDSPVQPSVSTDGGATNPQVGYRYNWCAAMGGQAGTNACTSAATPESNVLISICPAGWRIPTGSSSGEFRSLATALGAQNNAAGVATFREMWLAQNGYYWSSTQMSYPGYNTAFLSISNSNVNPISDWNWVEWGDQSYGFSLRCIASN